MENGLKEFKEWLSSNGPLFRSSPVVYNAQHIADLAIGCGYDRQVVAQWLVSETFKEAI